MSLLWLASALAGAEPAESVEWTAELGADVQTTSHGLLTVAVRKGPWSAGLYTDTLDLRWSPESDRGRSWVAARAEFGAAGLMITPWSNGAPDPDRAWFAGYAGVEAGRLRYLPGGAYVGWDAQVRWWFFEELGTAPAPDHRPVASAHTLVGVWRPALQGWASIGGDLQPQGLAPSAQLTVTARPQWRVAPRGELRAGIAQNQDVVLKTRVGGLMPYVVPLAGAAWGEFWVEDYAAVRAGGGYQGALVGQWRLRADLLVDAVVMDDKRAAGFAVDTRIQRGVWHLDTAVGWSPWLRRPDELQPVALWIKLGREWA